MKNGILILVVAVALSHSATAQTLGRTITVSGDAEVRVVPDEVRISMTAEDRGADLLATKAKNDRTVRAFIDYATKTLGIEARYVQTDFVSVEPEYRSCGTSDELSGKCSPLDITYYNVSKGIQVSLKDLTKYEELVTKALELGVKRIDNIQFITTELRKHRDEARELAAKASREKAQAIGATLGMKVGKPISISSESYSSYFWHNSYGQRGNNNYAAQNVMQQAPAPSGEGASNDLAIGQISVTAQVNVTYEME